MNYNQEFEFAVALAKEAGDIMRRYFRAEDIGTEWKEDNTPLTVADSMINKLVIQKVKAAYPDHAVIGEEESYDNTGEYVWVVDPIDGTIPFSLGMPLSTFSLALVARSDGQSVIGIAYEPILDQMYTAVRCQGAFLNGESVKATDKKDLKNSYTSVIGNFKKHHISYGKCVEVLRDQGTKSPNLMSQVYSAVKIASGEMIGSVFIYGSPWDSAAASIIVEEAGGVVTDLSGNKRRFDEWSNGCLLAANQTILDKLVEAVEKSKQ